MHGPKGLYDSFYPAILKKNLPKSLLKCLTSSLDEDPQKRTSFQAMYDALESDTSAYVINDDLIEDAMWIDFESAQSA
jgi:hypothetical protein